MSSRERNPDGDISVAQLEEIAEVQGTTPFRPVRQHFGIMTFGVNTMTRMPTGTG